VIKLASNFVRNLGTRVKCMFVRFFSLTTLFEITGKFDILESENQIIFFLLA